MTTIAAKLHNQWSTPEDLRIVQLARRLWSSPLWLRLQTDAERLALARLHRTRIHRSPARSRYTVPYRHRGRPR